VPLRLLLCGVLVLLSAAGPPLAQAGQSQAGGPVNVMYAATLVGTFENHVGPAFD